MLKMMPYRALYCQRMLPNCKKFIQINNRNLHLLQPILLYILCNIGNNDVEMKTKDVFNVIPIIVAEAYFLCRQMDDP